ncbi:hypothetical protein V5O48_009191 [Marasmius crinis-equi]|uniref:Glucose-methanol-choline oxidoreductase N-terminal domain-containing protein n=1 Tax=Marasmius crinis-equi TaxID=585013 RepID=A0ABR3FBS7_9AGAR
MWPVELVTTVLTFAAYATCDPLLFRHVKRAVYTGELQQSYDFVIIGGGQAGLTIASRLSEDSNTTVLVIEAGDSGQAVQDRISTPAFTYLNGLTKSEYDWSFDTVPQSNLGNRVLTWPAGKVLGGSSAINGMYTVRPSEIEVNAWSELASDGGAAKAWSWSEFYNAMETSQSLTMPKDDIKNLGHIVTDGQSASSNGPVRTGFPGLFVPVTVLSPSDYLILNYASMYSAVGDYNNALNAAAIATNPDAYSGKSWGGFVARSFIDNGNWTRSYSRSAYIDPISRPNLTILVKSIVTRIILDPNHTATGVEYAETRDGQRFTVGVKKEVIVTAGAVRSPQVLMLSGVGPRDVLTAANVSVQLELPGVGQRLQDHLSTLVVWGTQQNTSASLYKSGMNSTEFLSFVNSAVAYVNSSYLFADVGAFQKQVEGQFSESLIPSTSPEVLAGARAIYDARAKTILSSQVGQIELMFGMMFENSMSIGVAIQQPFSQGRVYINSSSAFDHPIVDPSYLSHPADKIILRQGVRAARNIGVMPALSGDLQGEISPGSIVASDDDIEKWLAGQSSTGYHPSSSCAMLPQSKGGVVDPNLKVYGLNNVRVADASVFPFVFSSHLGAPVYGLAEQAANIIRAQYNGVAPPGSSSNTKNGQNKAVDAFSAACVWTSVITALAVIECVML